ncbi:DNA-binding repressor [Trabulsiella guamensis ATCC 49490]|uniref:DNA-binding repressor n=1 Tax=Trabulsiella guamensis ATCC 49490 TaxID=1005994 RepID=A0A085A7F9_9ENTR|nr:helix-turn-helix transcriptional regulator [Trabulsiella guamensis]KFC06154.1 DNA-binding repressor [Trabulsiella guamensis ATCC 49490]
MNNEMTYKKGLQFIRKKTGLSQKNVADAMGITQSGIVAIEKRGEALKIKTLKRYVHAIDGKLSIKIDLSSGICITLHV